MRVLIVQSKDEIGGIWQRHLQRQGHDVRLATTPEEAIRMLSLHEVEVMILDLIVGGQPGLSVADYARYRRPEAQVILVTDTSFFSDGSIFGLMPNARAFVGTTTSPEDLAAMVEHYGSAA